MEHRTMEHLTERLLAQAYLFDDPSAYRAGVKDALASLEEAGLLAGGAGAA